MTMLVLPATIFCVYMTIKYRACKLTMVIFVLSAIGFAIMSYARFIEKEMINVQTTEIEVGFDAKIVLISDTHLGLYKGKRFLKRVVDKINDIEGVDAVIIAGDITYWPDQTQDGINDLLSPLADINVPVFAVVGNHDSQKPGPDIAEILRNSLEQNDVVLLHNKDSVIPGKDIKILGVGDKWAGQDKIKLIDNFSINDNLIVIAHNPDSTMSYKNGIADLTLSGHAHGGQIRIPFLYKYRIPCEGGFDAGLYDLEKGGKVFVSSGLGEVGLPMRMGIPPVIDILILK